MEKIKTSNRLGHIFHVDLSDKFDNEDYWLHVAGTKHPLVEHTQDTLAEAMRLQPDLKAMSNGAITHYTQVPVPMQLGTALRISVRHTNKTGKIPGDYGVHHVAIHVVHDHEANQMMAAKGQPITVSKPINYLTTAASLIFHHGDLITKDSTNAQTVMDHIGDPAKSPKAYALLQQLAIKMRKAGPSTKTTGWANYQDYQYKDGVIKQTLVPTATTISNAGALMTEVQITTKNDLKLKYPLATSYQVENGSSVQSSSPARNNTELMGSVNLGAAGDKWSAALGNTRQSSGLETTIKVSDSSTRQVEITMNNYYVRWLGAYIQFIDADGKTMNTPDWQPDDGGIIAEVIGKLGLNYDNLRFIGWISPINTIFSIPIVADPGTLTVKVTFPKNAVSANLYGCGLGTGNLQYPKSPVIGGVFTGLANLVIPTFLMGLGVAANSYKGLYKAMSNPKFVKAVVAIGAIYFGGDFLYKGAVDKKLDWHAFTSLTQILFTQACDKALVWVGKQTIEGEIEDEIPFAGWIMVGINIALGLVLMAETIIEVAMSPWMIANSISTTIDSTLSINPDPRKKVFPEPPSGSKASYITKMIYKDQNRPSVTSPSVTLEPGNHPSTLSAIFMNTLGGEVKFEVDFYIDNWKAGTASTAWLQNNEGNVENITLTLFQLPIQLDSKSVYKHTAILGYQNNAYTWIPQSEKPTGTLTNADPSQSGNAISIWSGLALSQRQAMIGLSWKAGGMGIVDCSSKAGGQLFAFQNINIPGAKMDSVKFPDCGFSNSSRLVYDAFPAKFLMKDGQFVTGNDGYPVPDPADKNLGNYYIDPRKAPNLQQNPTFDPDLGFHLRKVVLDAKTPFNMAANQNSYGRFPYFPDSITLHPSGHAIGVNSECFKLMITPLAAEPGLADDNIPLARTFAGSALNYNGSDGRPGLLFRPVGITCSYDGTILVLEQLSSEGFSIARIQAFDLNGNPVSCFTDANNAPSPFLILPNNITYLDVAAVGDNYTTYLYLLYYSGSGANVSDYNMALYQVGQGAPKGNLLVTTQGVPAAKINADMWHTMYTLNYQMTQDGQGANAGPKGGPGTGPAGVTVPSVSEWLPPAPK